LLLLVAVVLGLVGSMSVVPAGSQAAALPALEVKAHRGGWLAYGAPEESLKALTAAADDGVDWIEFDVVYTAAGTAVLQHADQVGGGPSGSATCTNAGQAIHTMSDEQVAAVRCDGEPIATLAQVLTMLTSHPSTKVDLEVKTYTGQSLAEKRDLMARTLDQTAAIHERMSISTFFWRELAATINAKAPKAYFLALEYANLVKLAKNADYGNLRLAKKLGADGFAYNVNSSDVGQLRFMRALGIDPHLYDFDTYGSKFGEQVRFAIANGQRDLGADNPHQLRALIASLNGQTPTPRLVVTGLPAKTVVKKKLSAAQRSYPKVIGASGTVPSSAQTQFDSVRVKVKITAKRSGGLVEVAPRNSRVGVDGVQVKIAKGTHSYVLFVSPGDYGQLRIRTTKTVQLSVAVTGYRIARFA
jgi:glycerophosphoryl diester phosphodiesterase